MRPTPLCALLLMLVGVALIGPSRAEAACTVPNQLANGQTADAAQVMTNFNAVTTCINASPVGATNSVQTNAGSGAFGSVAPLTNGQLVIGSTGAAPAAANLTAGPGITIANGPGTVTISGSGGGGGAVALISSVVTSGSQLSVVFSSIPATYRDLFLVVRGRSNAAILNDALLVQFNNDIGADYQYQQVVWTNTSSGANQTGGSTTALSTVFFPGASASAGYSETMEMTIFDYRGTVFNKTVAARSGGSLGLSSFNGGFSQQIALMAGSWASTAAITSLRVILNSAGSFVDGTVVSLYGRF